MTVTSPPAFTIRVPPSWFRFDAWRANRPTDLARLVDARLRAQPGLRPYRSTLVSVLRESADEAQRRGAVMAAVTAEPIGSAGTLVASLMVFVTTGDPAEPDATPESIAADITAHEGADGPGTWRKVAVVDHPAGRAVRVTGVNPLGTDDLVLAMHTLHPVPGGGVLDVVLTSPQTTLAEPLLDLFDAVSGTFAWTSDETAASSDAPGSGT